MRTRFKFVDWERVLELRRQGLSSRVIAERIGCSSAHVTYILKSRMTPEERRETLRKTRRE